MRSQKVILLLGGNQGEVHRHFMECLKVLQHNAGTIYAHSRIYRTKAWGPVKQDDFLNMAVALRTIYPPHLLLQKLLSIEKRFGRKRDVKYGPRTLDIDILFYGSKVINEHNLRIPHPEIPNRRFALVACCDIAGSMVHPVLDKTIRQLLDECKDPLSVELWTRK